MDDPMERVVAETTREFCEAFASAADCRDVMASFVAEGLLPEGVDPADERVIAVVQRCKDVNEKYKARIAKDKVQSIAEEVKP